MRAVLVDTGPIVALLDLDRRDFDVYRLTRKGKFTILPRASR